MRGTIENAESLQYQHIGHLINKSVFNNFIRTLFNRFAHFMYQNHLCSRFHESEHLRHDN